MAPATSHKEKATVPWNVTNKIHIYGMNMYFIFLEREAVTTVHQYLPLRGANFSQPRQILGLPTQRVPYRWGITDTKNEQSQSTPG